MNVVSFNPRENKILIITKLRRTLNGEKSPQIILIILIKLQVRLFKMHVPVVVLLLVITGDKKQVRYRLHMHTFIVIDVILGSLEFSIQQSASLQSYQTILVPCIL